MMMTASAIDNIEDALGACGVTDKSLGAAEKMSLDRDGYLLFHNVIDAEWLDALRTCVDSAMGDGKRHGQHVGLPWHEPLFDRVYTHPRILAAAYHVLKRPFRFTSVVARDPAKGHGQQALHADWPRQKSQPYLMVTTLWLLDDFTRENGATRVVPGSHPVPNPLSKSRLQPNSRHPDEKVIEAEAGSVLLFNSHLLHSGTRNQSGQRRRVLQCGFFTRLPGGACPEIPERLPAAARYLLGADGS
jgi:hypothetical protein